MPIDAVRVDLGIVQINLERCLEIVRSLSKDKKTKAATKAFVVEVNKAYKVFVKSVAGFYKMGNDESFQSDFSLYYSAFRENLWLDYLNKVQFTCDTVQNQIIQVLNNPPRLKKSSWEKLKILFNSSDALLLRDQRVYEMMKSYYKQMDRGLTEIYSTLYERPVADSRRQLQLLLSDTADVFEKIQNLLLQLDVVSSKF